MEVSSSISNESSLSGKSVEDMMDKIQIVKSSVKFIISSSGSFPSFHDSGNGEFYWVDKSLLIKEVIALPKEEVVIITRPRGFGKTSNLSMLYAFFSVEVDNHGNICPNGDKEKKFQELLIGQMHFDLVKEHCGKYPCILLDLSSIQAHTETGFIASVRELVSALFEKHSFLLNSGKLQARHKAKIRLFLYKLAEYEVLTQALKRLTMFLRLHFGRNVYIFVDKFDQAMAATEGNDREQIQEFLTVFLGCALKDNEYLEKGIITGILPVCVSTTASRFNNATYHTVLDDDQFSPYFGFSEEEMAKLYEEANVKNTEVHRAIKEYYGGYYFGKQEYYNPFSVANFFTTMELKPYWTEESVAIANGLALKSVQPSAELLRMGELLVSDFEYQRDMKQIRDILYAEWLHEIRFDRTEYFWTLLIHSGYVTLGNWRRPKGDETKNRAEDILIGEARIPNREVRSSSG